MRCWSPCEAVASSESTSAPHLLCRYLEMPAAVKFSSMTSGTTMVLLTYSLLPLRWLANRGADRWASLKSAEETPFCRTTKYVLVGQPSSAEAIWSTTALARARSASPEGVFKLALLA